MTKRRFLKLLLLLVAVSFFSGCVIVPTQDRGYCGAYYCYHYPDHRYGMHDRVYHGRYDPYRTPYHIPRHHRHNRYRRWGH